MKRKLVIILVAHGLLLLLGGGYLAFTIRGATDDLSRTIRLHRTDLLREAFLVRLRAARADLRSGDPVRARAAAAAVEQLTGQGGVDGCFGCHHSESARAMLEQLEARAAHSRRALAARPSAGAGPEEVAAAQQQGEALDAQVRKVMDVTAGRIEAHTLTAVDDIARTRWVAGALVVVAPLLSLLLALVAVRGLGQPLDALLEATRRLRAGQLDHRVEGLRDEFAELSTSFNEMARSLQAQMQALERTSQLAVVGELAAGLVHEIKNPLAGIKAATQVLAQEAGLSGEDREVLRKVAREVDGLETLLKGFLAFARPVKPKLAEVDVNAFVRTVVAFWLKSHARGGVGAVRVETALGLVPAARADAMQLQQILVNLLLNASEASPAGGTVEVRTAHAPATGEVVLEVADEGHGISAQHAGEIFRPFFTTKPGGNGLGLAVSSRLAVQQGARITFEARPGGGTVFRVHLPEAEAAVAAS
jgi:signal transduction histidine kinase